MIDQLPTAVPQTAQSVNTSNRDRKHAGAEKDDQAGSFEDIVAKAGQKQAREGKGKDAEIELGSPAETETPRSANNRATATFDLSAALRGFGTSPQSQQQGQGQKPAQVQVNAQAQLKLAPKDIARAASGARPGTRMPTASPSS